MRYRDGTKNCQVAMADLVLLHNKAAEGLAKNDRAGYGIYLGIMGFGQVEPM